MSCNWHLLCIRPEGVKGPLTSIFNWKLSATHGINSREGGKILNKGLALPVELSVFQILVRLVPCQSSSELCCECVQEHCHVFIMPHQIYSEVNIGAINHVSGCWVGKILVGGHVLVTGVVVLTENFLTEFFLLLLLLFFRGYKIRNPFFFFCCEL